MSPVPGYDSRFSTFQLVLEGFVLGNEEPCIPYSALALMCDLPWLDDSRLDTGDPHLLRTLLTADESLRDRTLGPSTESLDPWGLRRFRIGDQVAYLAWSHDEPEVAVLVWLAEVAHQVLADAAMRDYRRRSNGDY